MQALVGRVCRRTIHSDLEVTFDQPRLQITGARVDNIELDRGIAALRAADELDELLRGDRAHHSELQDCALDLNEIEPLSLRLLCLAVHLLEIRLQPSVRARKDACSPARHGTAARRAHPREA